MGRKVHFPGTTGSAAAVSRRQRSTWLLSPTDAEMHATNTFSLGFRFFYRVLGVFFRRFNAQPESLTSLEAVVGDWRRGGAVLRSAAYPAPLLYFYDESDFVTKPQKASAAK